MSVTPCSKYFEFSTIWQQSWVQEADFPRLPSSPAVYWSQTSCTTSAMVLLASTLEAAGWGAEPFMMLALKHAFINPYFIIPE